MTVEAVRVKEEEEIQTPRGPRTVHPGDWILTNDIGERWTMTDILFRATFDPTDEESRRMLEGD
jgi:hypothetical protein